MTRVALRLALLVGLTLVLAAPSASARPRTKKLSVPEFYELAQPTIATVEFSQEFVAGGQRQQTQGLTDGFVVSPDGLVLVSGRVRFPQRGSSGRISGGSLPQLSGFRLRFADGREHDAEVVTFDDDLNLGLLRVTDLENGETLPSVVFHDRYRPEVGHSLRSLTLYTPQYGRQPVYSPMSINALLDVPQDVWSLSGASASLLGAPLWDGRGRIVGVVAMVPMSPWGGRQVVPDLSGPVGLPYARFADWLEDAMAQARQQREAQTAPKPEAQAWMGVMFQPLEKDLAVHLGISAGGGIVLTRIVPGSPAEAAGLAPLDVLVECEGERIAVLRSSDTTAFSRWIRRYEPGITIEFVREKPGGARDTLSMTLAPTPLSELHAERRTNEPFELTVRELTLDTLLGQRLAPETPGVVVDGVTRAGWSGLSGLYKGLIIQRINELEVVDLDTFEAALALVEENRPEQVLFFVRYGRTTRFLVAEPDWDDVVSGAP
jgi:S1-C subfamily serine protease